MRTFAGQAALHCGRLLHWLARTVLLLGVLGAAALFLLSWRLSRGPLELSWLTHRLEQAANEASSPTRLAIGSAAVAWEGFRRGVDRPFDIRLTDITVTDADGDRIAALPRAEVSMSIGWLLLGRIVPRAIEVDGARLRVLRASDGSVALDIGSLAEATEAKANTETAPAGAARAAGELRSILGQLSAPIGSDHGGHASQWSQLRRVRIQGAAVTVVDGRLGATWRAPQVDVDLHRPTGGGIDGDAEIALALGDQTVHFHAEATAQPATRRTSVRANLTPLVPARVASLASALAPLAAVDAAVTLSASAELGPDLLLADARVQARIGAGQLHFGQGSMPLLSASIDGDGDLNHADIKLLRLETAPRPDGPRTVVQARLQAKRESGHIAASLGLDLDQAAFSDLAAIWPEGVGGPGTGPWITRNITTGIARNGHVELAVRAPGDLSDAEVTSIAGGLDGKDMTVHWLRPVPPIEHVDAHLTLMTPDMMQIAIRSGREAGGAQGGVAIRDGRITLAGIAGADQFADIESDLAGPVADAITLLRNPRLGLLARRPIEMGDPSGQLAGKLTVGHVLLADRVTMDEIQIKTALRLTDVHLGGLAAGRDLDHGNLDLDAGNDGLRVGGTAQLAGIDSQLKVAMDFRDGPPSEVLQKVTVSAPVDERQLGAAGLDVSGFMSGQASVDASWQTRRDGRGDITLHADLARAALQEQRLNWQKAAGQPTVADAHVLLDHDRLAAIERVSVQGERIDLQGRADAAGGRPSVLQLQRLVLGEGTDAHGEMTLPASAGGAYAIALTGRSLDASGEFGRHTGTQPKPPGKSPSGAPWVLDARFDRVLLGHDNALTGVTAHADNDGSLMRQVSLTGRTNGNAPFELSIKPQPGGRRLSATTGDAGGLLRALDVVPDMQGGNLTLSGNYDDTNADHRLSGTAQILDFRLRKAPAMARLLQAMTLYGLVGLVQGPGLRFDRLEAPFQQTGDILELSEARVFNESIGMTAKGRLDLASASVDLQGTIVPAYFFNSLLGDLPLVGHLFSPERGGGVFAATYTLRGPLSDPTVSVNPLAALTPGFLRGVFGDVKPVPGKPARPQSAAGSQR